MRRGEPVEHYRALVRESREEFLPVLARALTRHASEQQQAGQKAQALGSWLEAAGLLRELHARFPDAFAVELAICLQRLARAQYESGQPQAALSTMLEAVGLLRDGANLDLLATLQRETGDHEGALASATEAVGCCHGPADRARCLHNLSNRQAEMGLLEEALSSAREAVSLYRELACAHPDSFLPSLALACGTLAQHQSAMGLAEEALKTALETTRLQGELAERDAAFLPPLARLLNNLANRHTELGQRTEAFGCARRSVGVLRVLAAADRSTHLPDLAVTLQTLAGTQSALGLHSEALSTMNEAVALLRELGPRGGGRTSLAQALHALARRQLAAGQLSAVHLSGALASATEAAAHYHELRPKKASDPKMTPGQALGAARCLGTLAELYTLLARPASILPLALDALPLLRAASSEPQAHAVTLRLLTLALEAAERSGKPVPPEILSFALRFRG